MTDIKVNEVNQKTTQKAFSTRLSALLSKRGAAAQLADAIKVSRPSVKKWMHGEAEPGRDRLVAISVALGVNVQWLLTGEGPVSINDLPGFTMSNTLPVIGFAACGLDRWFNETNLRKRIPTPVEVQQDSNAFCVIAKGTSMQPEGIQDGFYCIVSPDKPHKEGDVVFLKDNHDRVSIKRFVRLKRKDQEKEWIELNGWGDQEPDGTQPIFTEEQVAKTIKHISPVVAILREPPILFEETTLKQQSTVSVKKTLSQKADFAADLFVTLLKELEKLYSVSTNQLAEKALEHLAFQKILHILTVTDNPETAQSMIDFILQEERSNLSRKT